MLDTSSVDGARRMSAVRTGADELPMVDCPNPQAAAPESCVLLSLSTAHLPQHVRDDLDAIATPEAHFPPSDWRAEVLAARWFDYGWIVHIPEDEGNDAGIPSALADCLAFARRHGAEFLKFDVDVEPLDGLPVHA